MGLMNKVTLEIHPSSVEALAVNPSSRPTRVEIRARGQTFAGEKRFPKGTPSPDTDSFMTTDELVLKFRSNAEGIIPAANIDRVVDGISISRKSKTSATSCVNSLDRKAMNLLQLESAIVPVTGAASGIGLQLSQALACRRRHTAAAGLQRRKARYRRSRGFPRREQLLALSLRPRCTRFQSD